MSTSNIMDTLRTFFAAVDRKVYSLIGFLYELITDLATTKLIEETAIDQIANKIYSLLAVFMLFRISFSIINYIINPDSVTDKEKGGPKIIVNIIITFALIILTPTGFDLLYDAQSAIIEDNILPHIILDTNGEAPATNEFIISTKCLEKGLPYIIAGSGWKDGEGVYNAGEYIAMMTIRPFVQIDTSASDDQIKSLFDRYNYCRARTIDELLTEAIIKHPDKKGNIYTIDYTPLVSTVIGIILVLIFVGFVLDVALRTVKLAFLEIIAPIPIISYIDPSSAKKGLFSKWLKEVGLTWADLFLRLSAVYFAIYLISTITLFDSERGYMVNLFLILGILMFAKKLPDILKKLLNIDLKGNFKFNPLKRIQEDALGGKVMMGLGTGAAGAAIGLKNFAHGDSWEERISNAGRGLKTGFMGGFKNPTTLKGLRSGTEFIRKEKEEKKEARRKAEIALANIISNNKKAKGLVENGISQDPITGEYKLDETKNFKDQKYIDSFNRVKRAKDAVKAAENAVNEANFKANRVANDPNASDTERREAIDNQNKAQAALKKANGQLDFENEQHKHYQSIYADDAERETLMKNYMKRHDVDKSNGAVTSLGSLSSGDSLSNPLGGSGQQKIQLELPPDGANHQDFTNLRNEIKRLTDTISTATQQRNDLTKQREATIDVAKSTQLEEMINKMSDKIGKAVAELQVARINENKLMEEHPDEAIKEIEYRLKTEMSDKLKSKEDEIRRLEKELEGYQDSGRQYDSSGYKKVKATYDRMLEEKKDVESEINKLSDRVKEFKKVIEAQANNNRNNSTSNESTSNE